MSAVRVTAMLNGGAVVVAALYFGQELLVPLVLAGLLAFVLAPLARLLQRAYLPHSLASILAVVIAFVILGLLSVVVGGQVSSLIAQAPQYEANIVQKWHGLVASNRLVAQFARPLGNGLNEGASPLALAERFARPLLGPVTTAAVVLVFTLVILLYSEDLRDRFVRLVGRNDLHRTIFALNDAGHRLSRYFLSQLTINAAFGLWIGGALAIAGLPSPVLLGLIALLMRFVPFVGTFIGIGAPLALALAVAPDWSLAIIVLVLFAVSEVVVSQVVEPLLYGHSTGISPVAVLVATSFWTLLWGFVGLLIATPLTVCLVVIGRNVSALSFLDVLFGSESPLLPAETFYQRALEGRSLALVKPARSHFQEHSRADYYDQIALPGLILAQQDRGDDPDLVDPVHEQFEALLDALAPEPATPSTVVVSDSAWQREGAIMSIPARGDFDDLAAAMVAQALRDAGFGAVVAPNRALDQVGPPDADGPLLCCISVIDEAASITTIRLFVRLIQHRIPGAAVVVGLWNAPSDSALLAEIRSEGLAVHLTRSIGELLAYTKAISAQAQAA